MSTLSQPLRIERQPAGHDTRLALLFAFLRRRDRRQSITRSIYYAQPIGLIAPEVGLGGGAASLIVSLTQIGYSFAMFFLVPLSDLVRTGG